VDATPVQQAVMAMETISGPIVACDNAIQHYTSEIQKVAAEKQRREQKLVEVNANLSTLEAMREQWRRAKRVLEQQGE
jgi:hypothetical protein